MLCRIADEALPGGAGAMADIFVSYSKSDRALCARLAACLEAQGYTVWWDKSLKAGDEFRDEIVKELAKARAVIVIWTKTSVASDWVRSEAGRAKADGKLIPVRTSDIDYKTIPPPFDVLHTEIATNEELIRAAVVAQLAKPEVKPSLLHMTWATFRHQFLTWFGVVGAGITLFTGLKGVIELAGWASWLVTNWTEVMQGVWAPLARLLKLEIGEAVALALSFSAYMLAAAIGSTTATHPHSAPRRYKSQDFNAGSSWHFPWLLSLIAISSVVFFTAAFTLAAIAIVGSHRRTPPGTSLSISTAYMASVALFFAPVIGARPNPGDSVGEFAVLSLPVFFVPLAITLISDPERLAKRLWMSIGLAAVILALNEVSKLGISVTAPKVPG